MSFSGVLDQLTLAVFVDNFGLWENRCCIRKRFQCISSLFQSAHSLLVACVRFCNVDETLYDADGIRFIVFMDFGITVVTHDEC
jgi:hypothetical protein